jgi:hypothetical protein
MAVIAKSVVISKTAGDLQFNGTYSRSICPLSNDTSFINVANNNGAFTWSAPYWGAGYIGNLAGWRDQARGLRLGPVTSINRRRLTPCHTYAAYFKTRSVQVLEGWRRATRVSVFPVPCRVLEGCPRATRVSVDFESLVTFSDD